jgi:predicted nucleic acid-binding protein
VLAIDSNIWAYALDATVPEHLASARAVDRALKDQVLVNTVIQLEVIHYLVKRLGAVAGREAAEAFLSMPLVVDALDGPLVRNALRLLARYTQIGIGGRDASLLASMERNGVTRILTHDATFRRVDWVVVVDPVRG